MGLFGGTSKSTSTTNETAFSDVNQNAGAVRPGAEFEGNLQTGADSRVDFSTFARDIGLTGAAAVDLAAVLTRGTVEQGVTQQTGLNTLTQEVGKSYNTLVGGASDLVRTAFGSLSEMSADRVRFAETAERFGGELLDSAYLTSRNVGDIARDTSSDVLSSVVSVAGDLLAKAFGRAKDVESASLEQARIATDTGVTAQRAILASGQSPGQLAADNLSRYLPWALAAVILAPLIFKRGA